MLESPGFAIDGKMNSRSNNPTAFKANGTGYLTIDLVEEMIIAKVKIHFKDSSIGGMHVKVSVASENANPRLCASTGENDPSSTHEFVCNIPYIGSRIMIQRLAAGILEVDEVLVIGTRFSGKLN